MSVRQLPPVMPLSRAAKAVLGIDRHEAYRLAREGKIAGTFKIGKLWFVTVTTMIREMQKQH